MPGLLTAGLLCWPGPQGGPPSRTPSVPAVPVVAVRSAQTPHVFFIREAPAWGQVQGRTSYSHALPPRATPFSPLSSRATPQALICSPSDLTSESKTQAAETQIQRTGACWQLCGLQGVWATEASPLHGGLQDVLLAHSSGSGGRPRVWGSG